MRNKLLGLLLFALSFSALLSCETDGPDDYKDHFVKYYGGDGDQESKDLLVNDDGTVVMLGTSTETTGKKNVLVVKADVEGKQLWSLKLVGPTDEMAQDVEKISTGPDAGNYLIVSNAEKSVADSLAIRLTIVSETGDSLKSFLIDRYESQEAKSITILSTGQYYLTGKVKNVDTLNVELPGVIDLEDSFDMIIGSDFSLVSSDRFGKSTVASGVKILDRSNSINYALYTDEFIGADGVYESNFVFRRYNKVTNDKESFYSGSPRMNEYLADIDQSLTGIFLAVGTQIDPNTKSTKVYVTSINSSFISVNTEATVASPNQGEGVATCAAIDGNFFWVVGNEIRSGGLRNIWLGKLDGTDLSTVFSRTFGGPSNDDTASKVLQLDNGDVLILGTMELVNQKKMALIKIKANGSF